MTAKLARELHHAALRCHEVLWLQHRV